MKRILITLGVTLCFSSLLMEKVAASELPYSFLERMKESVEPSLEIPFLPTPFFPFAKWVDTLTTEEAKETVVLEGKKVVLDAGHGGNDSGASVNGLKEKEINLPVTLKTAEALKELGAEVFLTREVDVALQREERYLLPSYVNADLFISIHANSGEADVQGLETFFYANRDRKLAHTLHAHLINETNATSRGVKYGDYYVLRENTVPSALIETGFLSNSEESKKLISDAYQEVIAKGIAEGVVDYFK